MYVHASMVHFRNPSSASWSGAITERELPESPKSTAPPTMPDEANPMPVPADDVKSVLVLLDSFIGSTLSPRCHTPT